MQYEGNREWNVSRQFLSDFRWRQGPTQEVDLSRAEKSENDYKPLNCRGSEEDQAVRTICPFGSQLEDILSQKPGCREGKTRG
jgi:hypothetical protein